MGLQVNSWEYKGASSLPQKKNTVNFVWCTSKSSSLCLNIKQCPQQSCLRVYVLNWYRSSSPTPCPSGTDKWWTRSLGVSTLLHHAFLKLSKLKIEEINRFTIYEPLLFWAITTKPNLHNCLVFINLFLGYVLLTHTLPAWHRWMVNDISEELMEN